MLENGHNQSFMMYMIQLLIVCLVSIGIVAESSLLSFQVRIEGDEGPLMGEYQFGYGIFKTNQGATWPNDCQEANGCLWLEKNATAERVVNGVVVTLLGEDASNPISYDMLKYDGLHIGVFVFDDEDSLIDAMYVPLVSVPQSIYAAYSDTARVIEDTESWMVIDTTFHRVGIGVTNNLTAQLVVSGSVVATTVSANRLVVADGSGIKKLDYRQLIHVDNYSLDADDGDPVDALYVNSNGYVGINTPTDNITHPLSVHGDIDVNGTLYIHGDIAIMGESGTTPTLNNNPMFAWVSNKQALRVGYFSGNNNRTENFGFYSSAFGGEHFVPSSYSFAAGYGHRITGASSMAFGKHHTVSGQWSGSLSGRGNSVTGNASVIVGGERNQVNGNGSAVIGGHDNQVIGNNSMAIGGNYHTVEGDNSVSFGTKTMIDHDHVVMVNLSDEFRGSYADNQFLIDAPNGVGIGVNQITGQEVSGHTIGSNSLRVSGDIVADGHFLGDGRYLTNLSSLWKSDAVNNHVYISTQNVCVGCTNTSDPSGTFTVQGNGILPAALHIINSTETLTLEVSQDGDAIVKASNHIHVQIESDPKLGISSNGITFHSPVTFNQMLSASQAEFMTITSNTITANSVNVGGVVTANLFVGDGQGITNISASYLTPYSGTNLPSTAIMAAHAGGIGIGGAVNDPQAALHIATTNTHLRLADIDNNYADISMDNSLNLTVHQSMGSSDPLMQIRKVDSDGDVTPIAMFSSNGDMAVSGNLTVGASIHATAFSGDGSNLDSVQLDSTQNSSVTFDAGIVVQHNGVSFKASTDHRICHTDEAFIANLDGVLCVCLSGTYYKLVSSNGSCSD